MYSPCSNNYTLLYSIFNIFNLFSEYNEYITISLNILYDIKVLTLVKLRLIAISEENYLFLKSRGKTADSFNDVISEILKTLKAQQTDSGVPAPDQSVATTTHR